MVDSQNDHVRAREKPEPHEENAGIPWYMMALVGLAVVWGALYILINPYERDFEAPELAAADAGAGVNAQQIYNNNCASCHQANGLGVPGVFPPLNRSEWVASEDPRVVARILLNGMVGPVTVAGVEYNSMMPPFGAMFNDEELAALATFIRSNWDNNASPVTADIVAEERAAHEGRAAWTAEELEPLL